MAEALTPVFPQCGHSGVPSTVWILQIHFLLLLGALLHVPGPLAVKIPVTKF